MTRKLTSLAIGLLAATSVSTIVVADDMGSVTVQASRIVNEKMVGKTSSGIPIVDVSLSYGVNAKDLDLASHSGVLALQKRVNDAAHAACTELGRQYPDSMPKDNDCAKNAIDKATVRVNELAAAAAKKPGK